jgi:hypothetical protein
MRIAAQMHFQSINKYSLSVFALFFFGLLLHKLGRPILKFLRSSMGS